MKYYNVSFQYSENVYCSNIAHAETVEDVEKHYSEYAWVKVSDASEYDVKDAQRRGKPIIEVPHIEEAAEVEEEPAPTVDAIRTVLDAKKPRSAWDKGVLLYASDMLDELDEAIDGGYFDPADLAAPHLLERTMLNGADDWMQYSEGGCSLCHDGQIAERLCTPSELKKTAHGLKDPNPRENWIQCQARALFQAAELIKSAAREAFNA